MFFQIINTQKYSVIHNEFFVQNMNRSFCIPSEGGGGTQKIHCAFLIAKHTISKKIAVYSPRYKKS